ncbi:MAG TPA: hypothetical protein VFG68_12050 [Fimbriiglobus sp.]|nr:hypothetical protein [Fimbriiglobus sp.]
MTPAAVCCALALAVPHVPAPSAAVRQAVERALPLLAEGATGHIEQKTCFACHNQAFPMAAFAAAKARGFSVDADLIAGQVKHVREFVESNKDAYTSGRGTGGQVDTAGWLLFTLERAGHKPDDLTAAVVEYLLKRDADRDHWRGTSNRPPSEASAFTANYLALRGLKTWGTPEHKAKIAKRVRTVRGWLAETAAKDTEDRVYRMRALAEIGAKKAAAKAARALIAAQRADGGWRQTDAMPSDAYATGTVLTALAEVGGVATASPAYQKGVAFLVRTQRADGTWYVKSRSRPFQPYYESGFPHGKDQFISSSATGWATAALALACPK